MRMKMTAFAALLLAGCGTTNLNTSPGTGNGGGTGPVAVKIIAFNDFHGQLEPGNLSVEAPLPNGERVQIPVGGAAYLASAVRDLKSRNPNTVVVSAGDLISASPLVSSLFLDEPTVSAMNLIELDINAVGNHEFDRGPDELLRMQNGGCSKHTDRTPCRVEPFKGADFQFLAANVITRDGNTLFPPYSIKRFGTGEDEVRIGFIGMTLESTSSLVIPTSVASLTFRSEVETANALVPKLKAEGVDTIVLVIHEGARVPQGLNQEGCGAISGTILPIAEKLDPAIEIVVSGHTHNAYVCELPRGDAPPLLLTSAGKSGTLLTDIDIEIDPASGRIMSKRALNLPVQSKPFEAKGRTVGLNAAFPHFAAEPRVESLVARYAEAAKQEAERVVGRLTAPITEEESAAGEQALGNLIADGQLYAVKGAAEISFTSGSGIRADLVPAADGTIRFGDLYAAQPFGNELVIKTMTGAQIRRLLEQQFTLPAGVKILSPSEGFQFAYDASRPAGAKIIEASLNGEPLQDERRYRVVTNSFLAAGGAAFTLFTEGPAAVTAMPDIDATEAYLAARSPVSPPAMGRVRRIDTGNR